MIDLCLVILQFINKYSQEMKNKYLQRTLAYSGVEESQQSQTLQQQMRNGDIVQMQVDKLQESRLSDGDSGIYKINSTLPVFKMKKQGSQRQQIKTEYCSFDRNNSSNSIKMHSNRRSNQRHHLKPSQVPVVPRTTEFMPAKIQFKRKSQNDRNSGEEVDEKSEQNSSKSTQKKSASLSFENSQLNLTFLRRQSQEKKCGNAEMHHFMEQVNSKISHLTKRMTAIQEKNTELRQKISTVNACNTQKSQNLIKLLEEKEELIESRQKWRNGKEKLEQLHNEVKRKLRREKIKEKENMGKEECQHYFKQEKNIIKSSQSKSKKNILDKFHLKVSKCPP